MPYAFYVKITIILESYIYFTNTHWVKYSISQEICTRFLLCYGYTLTDFPISIRLTSLVLWQSNDCPSANKATLMNMDKYFMWIHYERLHNHNKAKHNKTVCIFLGIYCIGTEPNDSLFGGDILKFMYLYDICLSLIKTSLKSVPTDTNSNTTLVEIIVWRRTGHKSACKVMMA